jgi:hypothetical protein
MKYVVIYWCTLCMSVPLARDDVKGSKLPLLIYCLLFRMMMVIMMILNWFQCNILVRVVYYVPFSSTYCDVIIVIFLMRKA